MKRRRHFFAHDGAARASISHEWRGPLSLFSPRLGRHIGSAMRTLLHVQGPRRMVATRMGIISWLVLVPCVITCRMLVGSWQLADGSRTWVSLRWPCAMQAAHKESAHKKSASLLLGGPDALPHVLSRVLSQGSLVGLPTPARAPLTSERTAKSGASYGVPCRRFRTAALGSLIRSSVD